MKELLITSGFPRSGSTYLNQALNLLYYPEQEVNYNRHTVVAIEKSEKIMVTFRHPLNSIASWQKYPSGAELKADISFYIRFYSHMLNSLHKIVPMDFDQFTTSINYIEEKVRNNFNVESILQVTDLQVKEAMLNNDKEINLPRNNKEELQVVKDLLVTMPRFNECINLHAQLKQVG